MSNKNNPLVVQDLVKSYGPVQAVKGVSFHVEPGEVYGLLGPNGAGKTSIISTIVTLERPTSGHVYVFGADVGQDPRLTKMNTGWVPQEVINHGFFTVEEILKFHSGYYGKPMPKEKRDRLLRRLALWDHRNKKVKQLSGGMKRRLMIAKALVHEPQLLLLDEPTAGVDIELRLSLWEFVRELKNEGVSILLTTHYLEEAEELCDRVSFIDHGLIRREGKTKDIVRELTRKKIILKLRHPIAPKSHGWVDAQSDQEVHLNVPMDRDMRAIFQELELNPGDILDVQIIEGTLEDAFRRVIREATPS